MSLEGRWRSREASRTGKVGGGVAKAREASRRREMRSGRLPRLGESLSSSIAI